MGGDEWQTYGFGFGGLLGVLQDELESLVQFAFDRLAVLEVLFWVLGPSLLLFFRVWLLSISICGSVVRRRLTVEISAAFSGELLCEAVCYPRR